jgi:hypothetical protein
VAWAYKCEGLRWVGGMAHCFWPLVAVLGQCRDHTYIYAITGHKNKNSTAECDSVWGYRESNAQSGSVGWMIFKCC